MLSFQSLPRLLQNNNKSWFHSDCHQTTMLTWWQVVAAISRFEDFLPALLLSLPGRYVFPIPFNLDANATRRISEFCPIRGIDRRTGMRMPEWRAYPLGFFSIAHFNFLLSQWLKNWLRYRYLSCIHIRFGASFSPLIHEPIGRIDGRSWLRYGFWVTCVPPFRVSLSPFCWLIRTTNHNNWMK